MGLVVPEDIPYEQLVHWLQKAVKTEDGYAAVQWALTPSGYKLSPSYRPSSEEWQKRFWTMYPNGEVQLLDGPKSKKSVLAFVGEFSTNHDGTCVDIITHAGVSSSFSLRKATVEWHYLRGLIEIDGPRRGAVLLPADASYMV
jgi:hypothetical protein